MRTPVVERSTRDEWHIPDNVYILGVEADHDTLRTQRHTAAFLHHDDPVAEVKFLALQPINCMLRLEHRPPRNVLHHYTPEIGG